MTMIELPCTAVILNASRGDYSDSHSSCSDINDSDTTDDNSHKKKHNSDLHNPSTTKSELES